MSNNPLPTIQQLIAQERGVMAGKVARRNALKDALADLGRMSKTDAFERSITVRTELGRIDGEISTLEAHIRLLKKDQTLDEREAALGEQTILVPDYDSPEYPAYRQRLAEAVLRREDIQRQRADIEHEFANFR